MSDNPLAGVSITHPQVKFLQFVAERSGEIPWDWRKVERPDARAMVTDLINKRVLAEREYVTDAAQVQGRLHLRLTDMGRAIVARIDASVSKSRVVPAG